MTMLKKRLLGSLLPALALAGLGPLAGAAGAQAPAGALEGRWSGTLVRADEQRELVVTIHRAADGRLAGAVAGLDQGDAPIDAVEQDGARVKLVVGEASGGFEGLLSADGTRLTGAWSEIAIAHPLDLVRAPAGPAPSATR